MIFHFPPTPWAIRRAVSRSFHPHVSIVSTVRKALKFRFPGVNFFIDAYIDHDAHDEQYVYVTVQFYKGPALHTVVEFLRPYAYGEYNAKKGRYVYNSIRSDVPQVHHINVMCGVLVNFVP